MNSERLTELITKIPFTAILAAWVAYLGFDYYTFTTDSQSPLQLKQVELQATQAEVQKLQVRLKQAQEFLRSLEAKKAELRFLAQQLQEMKATLSENLDVPEFMKTTITEAKKVGLTVLSLQPTESSKQEYYAEQVFDFKFRGVYVQLLVFFERLAALQRIVRVDAFELKPVNSSLSRYVELSGVLKLKVYRYLGSKADSLGGDPVLEGSKPGGAAAGQPGGGG